MCVWLVPNDPIKMFKLPIKLPISALNRYNKMHRHSTIQLDVEWLEFCATSVYQNEEREREEKKASPIE